MMPGMKPEMMFGMQTSLLLWIALATLVFLLVAGTCVWLMLSLRKKRRLAPGRSRSQPQDAYTAYE